MKNLNPYEIGVNTPPPPKGKLTMKIPMTRDYIDENNSLWELKIYNNKIAWLYKGSVLLVRNES